MSRISSDISSRFHQRRSPRFGPLFAEIESNNTATHCCVVVAAVVAAAAGGRRRKGNASDLCDRFTLASPTETGGGWSRDKKRKGNGTSK